MSQYCYSLIIIFASVALLIISFTNIYDFVKNPGMTFYEFQQYIKNIELYDYVYTILNIHKALTFIFAGLYALSLLISILQEYLLSKKQYVQSIIFEYDTFGQSKKIKVCEYLFLFTYIIQFYTSIMVFTMLIIKINDLSSPIFYSYGIYTLATSIGLQSIDIIIKLIIFDKARYMPIYDNFVEIPQ